MEKMGEYSAEEETSISEKRNGLFERLDDLLDRNKKKIILTIALTIAAEGAGIAHNLQERSNRQRQEIVLNLDSPSDQKIYEHELRVDPNLADRLRQEVGVSEVGLIEDLDSVTSEEERKRYIAEHTKTPVEVSGFEVLSEKDNGHF
jgi:hypothetical protein